MKKIFALICCFLCVGLVFVGCSKEDDKYNYEVYDLWNEKVETSAINEYYSSEKRIKFDNDNINNLTKENGDFSEIERYQKIFCNIKSDISLLSCEFIHDPNLKGDEMKNAQKKVSSYKDQLKAYEAEIEDFKIAKHNFEVACETLDFADEGNKVEGNKVAGIIEKDEFKFFLSEFRALINSVNDVFSKMYDCACSMFYSGKVSNFDSNKERQAAVKENYFGAKVVLTADYIFYCYNNSDETQQKKDRDIIASNYESVKDCVLTQEKLDAEQSGENLAKIDKTIATLHTWIDYYKYETDTIKKAMNNGEFKYSVDGLEANNVENALIKQNHEKYLDLINSIMKNLSETCVSLVAFY